MCMSSSRNSPDPPRAGHSQVRAASRHTPTSRDSCVFDCQRAMRHRMRVLGACGRRPGRGMAQASPCARSEVQHTRTIPTLGTCVNTENEDSQYPGQGQATSPQGYTRTRGRLARQARPGQRPGKDAGSSRLPGRGPAARLAHITKAEDREIYHDYPSDFRAAFFQSPLVFWLTVCPGGAVSPRAGERNLSG